MLMHCVGKSITSRSSLKFLVMSQMDLTEIKWPMSFWSAALKSLATPPPLYVPSDSGTGEDGDHGAWFSNQVGAPASWKEVLQRQW